MARLFSTEDGLSKLVKKGNDVAAQMDRILEVEVRDNDIIRLIVMPEKKPHSIAEQLGHWLNPMSYRVWRSLTTLQTYKYYVSATCNAPLFTTSDIEEEEEEEEVAKAVQEVGEEKEEEEDSEETDAEGLRSKFSKFSKEDSDETDDEVPRSKFSGFM